MAFYFIANIRVDNPDEYSKYLDRVDETFEKSKGEYLVVDTEPVILEGKWEYTKSVVIKFESKQDFNDWYYSDDYQEILKIRLASAKCDSILAEGIE